jgi:hypothetical protein
MQGSKYRRAGFAGQALLAGAAEKREYSPQRAACPMPRSMEDTHDDVG